MDAVPPSPTSPAPRVTVVIPCFNYGHHLAEAVASVVAQTERDWEAVIVDDGSSDDSAAVAEALVAAHPDLALRLLRRPHSGSPGLTRNAGIAATTGEYVVCLDADDRLDVGYLAACAVALDTAPRAAIAYGDLRLFGSRDELMRPPEWDERTECDCNFLGVSSMFRRRAWEQVGGYDTEIGYEDWDFWIGCIEHGWFGVRAPGAVWEHREHGEGVYAGHLVRDAEIKARIALKHPRLYGDGQRRWAEAVLAGDAAAIAAAGPGRLPADVPSPARVAQASAGLPIRSICLLTKDYPPHTPGGIPRAVQMQAHRLAARGVDVHVITCAADGVAATREDAGVLVHELPEPPLGVPGELGYLEIALWSFVAAAKFAELDATVRFDVLETPDYRGEALHLVPRPETALVVWLHSTMKVCWDCEPGYVMTPADHAWHALEMAALQRADLLLGPSQLLIDTTDAYLGERMRPAELMPYLFDSDQFPVLREPRRPGPAHVLFYGRLEPRKNPEMALYAVAAARARGLDARLTMLGRNNGGYRESVLTPLQAQLGLDDVTYLPHADLDGLRAVLARTDVAILASRFDNSPLTIFEALSSGVPVITSDRVGTASWVASEDGLLTLPVDDVTAFAQRASAAIDDEAFMSSGPRAAARMREAFAPELVTDRLLECYRRLMVARGRPAVVAPRAPAAAEPASAAPAPAQRAGLDGARGHAALAFADELAADPGLLAAWGAVFDARDDVTLVIYGPNWTTERAERELGPVVAAAGLDGAEAADLLALATPADPALERRLASACAAVLTRALVPAPFSDLPALDGAAVGRVRSVLGVDDAVALPVPAS